MDIIELKDKFGKERSLIVDFKENYDINIPNIKIINEQNNKKRFVFNKTELSNERRIKEVPFPMVFSMVIMSILCVLLSLLAIPAVRDGILAPAINILMDPGKYSTLIIGM